MEDKQEMDMNHIDEEELRADYLREKEAYKAAYGTHYDYGNYLIKKEEDAKNSGNNELAKCYSKLYEEYIEYVEDREREAEEENRREEDKRIKEEEEYEYMREQEENDYIEGVYLDKYSLYSESDYESFEDYIQAEIEEAQDDKDDVKVQILYDVLELHNAKSKVKDTKTNEKIDNDSLESLTTEELIELATRNQGTINENDQVIKDALIKRILEQQQEIGEQEEEIKRLRGQKVI